MGARGGRRRSAVAVDDRLGDGAVLAHRSAHHLDRQRVADLSHDQRQAQARRQLLQLPVAGQAQHRGVEGGVLVEIGLHATRRVGEDHRDLLDEARARRLVRRLRGEARGERLHLDPDLEQLADVARRQPPHHRAAMRRVLDQPFGGKAAQRFAHRPAAHRKTPGQRALDQPLARLQPMGEDVATQAVDDMGDRRAVRRRISPFSAPRRSSRRRSVHVLPLRLLLRNARTPPPNGAAERARRPSQLDVRRELDIVLQS